jgi:hypothetical protein
MEAGLKPGDIVEVPNGKESGIRKTVKKGLKEIRETNVYAQPGDLVKIITLNHWPVLIVHLYEKPDRTFAIRQDEVTKEYSLKNQQILKSKKC